MPTITVHPSAVLSDLCSVESVDSSNPYSNAVGKGTDNESYAQWYMVTGGAALTIVYYSFDLSQIPDNAVIQSVTCQAKCQCQNSSSFRGGNNTLSLLCGTDVITNTSGTQAFGTSATVVTIPETTWTREQLRNCRLKIQGARGLLGTSTSYWMRFYGADLTVTYEEDSGTGIYLKKSGAYVQAQAVYAKEAGAWKAISKNELQNMIDSGKKYRMNVNS